MKGVDSYHSNVLNQHLIAEDQAVRWHDAFIFAIGWVEYTNFEKINIIDVADFHHTRDDDPNALGEAVRDEINQWKKFYERVITSTNEQDKSEIFTYFSKAYSDEDFEQMVKWAIEDLV